MNKTVTIDYDEYQNTLIEANRTKQEIYDIARTQFNNWRKNYEEQRTRNERLEKEGLLQAMHRKKIKCISSQNIFGNVKAEEISKLFDELEDMIREL